MPVVLDLGRQLPEQVHSFVLECILQWTSCDRRCSTRRCTSPLLLSTGLLQGERCASAALRLRNFATAVQWHEHRRYILAHYIDMAPIGRRGIGGIPLFSSHQSVRAAAC